MVFQVITSQDGTLLNILQASSMLPHFAYMWTKLFPTKTSHSQALWMIWWWPHLRFSSVTTLAHAFNTPTKTIASSRMPSYCMFPNNSSVFCPYPHFTCLKTMPFQVTTFQDGMLLNIVQTSSRLSHFAYMSSKLFLRKTLDFKPFWTTYSWTNLHAIFQFS